MFGELAAAEEFALHEEETNAERSPERKAAIKKRRRQRGFDADPKRCQACDEPRLEGSDAHRGRRGRGRR